MSHQAQLQVLQEEIAAWKKRCMFAESAANDAYTFMHSDVITGLDKNNPLVVSCIRVTSRLYPDVNRFWDKDFRKWF